MLAAVSMGKGGGHQPAALNAGVIVQPKANQNAPATVSFVCNIAFEILDEPIVPNTTQGKVLPRMNSRILVKTSSPPPRKIIGPLDKAYQHQHCMVPATFRYGLAPT